MRILSSLLIVVMYLQAQPEIRIPDLEERVHELINAERKEKKASSLRFDARLSDIARRHSEDMAKRAFFNHVNPDGQAPRDRAEAFRYKCSRLGENIFQNNLFSRVTRKGTREFHDWNTAEDIAESTVNGWMNSPGHRSNILDRSFVRQGIGAAIGPDGKVYITQMLCR